MTAAIPAVRRLWAVIRPGAAGKFVLELTARDPDTAGMAGALLLTGMLADDDLSLSLDLVSDPAADPALTGPTGPNGWTPVLAGEADGTRTLLRVVDWIGGNGAKPALGYVGGSGAGALVAKAAAFNFNAVKRVDVFTGVSGATGIADVVFDPPFATVPAKVLPMAVNNLLTATVEASILAGSVTKAGCKVRVQQKAIVGGVVSLLAGAAVQVIAIEG